MPHLWHLLTAKLSQQQQPEAAVTLTDALKQYVWSSLLAQAPLDVHLCLPDTTAGAAESPVAQPK